MRTELLQLLREFAKLVTAHSTKLEWGNFHDSENGWTGSKVEKEGHSERLIQSGGLHDDIISLLCLKKGK